MDDYDDSLEVGIAAGLDIPTAMAMSAREDRLPKKSGCSPVLVFIIVAELLGMVIVRLLH